jgi:hypothetical protein
MALTFSQIQTAKAELLQDLRDRTVKFLEFFGYNKKQMATAVGVSETHLGDYLNSSRGLSETTYAKIEHILCLPADQREKLFPAGGNRIVNVQSFGNPVADVELDPETMTMFEHQQTETHLAQVRTTCANRNADTTFAGRNNDQENFSK